MLIEIVGIDGSGKTTAVQAVRRRLNEAGDAFAYERSFQSQGVRLLELAASRDTRRRPEAVFHRAAIEAVRTTELINWSSILSPFVNARRQVYFCDGYIVEQLTRIRDFGIFTSEYETLLDHVVAPDARVYLKIPAAVAIERMRKRPKGDAILLAPAPLAKAQSLLQAMELALERFPADLTIDAESPADDVQHILFEYVTRLLKR